MTDVFFVLICPVNHREDFNIRVHIFLCIIGMLFHRYLAWRCKPFRMSLKGLVEEFDGICVALVKDKTGDRCRLVVEEMWSRQARPFSLLDLGWFMA